MKLDEMRGAVGGHFPDLAERGYPMPAPLGFAITPRKAERGTDPHARNDRRPTYAKRRTVAK